MRTNVVVALIILPLLMTVWLDRPDPAFRVAIRLLPTASTPSAVPPDSTEPEPRWPADWPSLDPVRAGGMEGTQTMGSGDVDVDLPGSTTGDGPVAGDPDAPPGEDENLERLGQMIRDRYEEEGDAADGNGDEDVDPRGATTDEAPFGGYEPGDGAVAGDPDGPPGEDENLERLGGMIRDRYEEEGNDAGNGGNGAPPPPAATPGFTLRSPDGRPLDNVVLSQPFVLELRLLPEQASVPGRQGGRRELEFVDVTLEAEDGEQTVRLWRDEEPSQDGLVRFATRQPISLAGVWGRNVFVTEFSYYTGTVDELGIDLDETEGSAIVRLRAGGDFTGGFSTFGVYGDQVQLGLAAVELELDIVETYLQSERRVATAMKSDPDAGGDAALQEEMRKWLERIDRQLAIVRLARHHLEHQDKPIFKLTYAGELLSLVRNADPNGPPVRDTVAATSREIGGTDEALNRAASKLKSYQTDGIVPPIAMKVVEGYLLGTYATFAHLTGGAAFWKLATGTDEFGREGSRIAAVVEIGTIAAMVWLPPKIVDYLAGGGEFGLRVSWQRGNRGVQVNVPGRQVEVGMRGSAGVRSEPAPVGSGSGRLAAETAGGELVYPGTRGANRGLPTTETTYWRGRSRGNDTYVRQLDDAVSEARRRGVSDEAIDAALVEARDYDIVDAVGFVEKRLDIEVALQSGDPVFVGRPDRSLIQAIISEGDASITAAHAQQLHVTDLATLESAIAKAHLEAQGRPQQWTAHETRILEDVVRRVDEGQNLAGWKVANIDEITITNADGEVVVVGNEFTGVETMFRQGDIEAILTVFGPRTRGVRGGRSVVADAPPLSLASAEEYAALLRRQTAGETLDLSGMARPGIVTGVRDGQLALGQGAGRWDNTRPDEWLDVFVRADTKIPDGLEVRVLETDVPAEIVRTTNLLSARGPASSNPRIVNAIVPEGTRWNRLQVRARDVRVGTSDVNRDVLREIQGLRDGGVDVSALERALAPLSPNERARVLQDPVARDRAIHSGVATVPPKPSGERVVRDILASPETVGGPSGRGGSSAPVEIVIRSLGGSTGTVFQAYAVNHGDGDEPAAPVRLVGSGVVLEPLDPDPAAQARIDEIIEAATAGKPVPPPDPGRNGAGPMAVPREWRAAPVVVADIEAYCLEFAGGVPTEGMVFRIADAATQAAHSSLRAILASSRALRERGGLHPDSEPTAYFHSLRQWAIWVDENDLDRAGFEETFVKHARRNFEAAGRQWTDEVERTVRRLVPNRWNDVVAVLEGADIPVR